MYELEKEKKQSEEAKHHEDAKETVAQPNVFGGNYSFANSDSPTNLNPSLYTLILTLLQNKEPEILKALSE